LPQEAIDKFGFLVGETGQGVKGLAVPPQSRLFADEN
jgi:hypothetical protein